MEKIAKQNVPQLMIFHGTDMACGRVTLDDGSLAGAVVLFSSHAAAQSYIQANEWEGNTVQRLPYPKIADLLDGARKKGVEYVMFCHADKDWGYENIGKIIRALRSEQTN